jgi:hypothetical protein
VKSSSLHNILREDNWLKTKEKLHDDGAEAIMKQIIWKWVAKFKGNIRKAKSKNWRTTYVNQIRRIQKHISGDFFRWLICFGLRNCSGWSV